MYQSNNNGHFSRGGQQSRSRFSGGSRGSFGSGFSGSRGGSRGFGSRGGGGRGRRPMATFDPSMLTRKAETAVEAEVFTPVNSFAGFHLSEQITRNIIEHGYSTPTPIQDQVIPVLMDGRDVIGVANTGTGKTAAFLLPLLNKVAKNRNERVLIVAPTRELAVQINDEFKIFARGMGIFSEICIGGTPIGRQIHYLKSRPNFVIGTPGRLKDLEERRVIRFGEFGSIVLDEVDRMLDMGFLPDVKLIVSRLPQVRQSLFFSATMPEKIEDVARIFLKDPVRIAIRTSRPSCNVDQDVIKVGDRIKIEVLAEVLSRQEVEKTLIFGRTKHGIDKLVYKLSEKGFRVAAIHGNKSQNERQRALKSFRDGSIHVLLATDIASRGLDIGGITHVINYELPESYEDYVHRIGRTGRAGRKGVALTLVD